MGGGAIRGGRATHSAALMSSCRYGSKALVLQNIKALTRYQHHALEPPEPNRGLSKLYSAQATRFAGPEYTAPGDELRKASTRFCIDCISGLTGGWRAVIESTPSVGGAWAKYPAQLGEGRGDGERRMERREGENEEGEMREKRRKGKREKEKRKSGGGKK